MAEERLEAAEAVRQLGGSASWPQILRYSTNASVRRAIAAGSLQRVGRGVYWLPETPLLYPAATAAHGLLSHQSAARHWKLELLTPNTSTHVTVPRNARPQASPGVKLHFMEVAGQDDHDGVTSPLRTVLDCAVTLPFAEALAIADSSLRLALLTEDELINAAVERRGAGRGRMIRVATAASGKAANPFESALRAIVIEAGIEGFEPQLQVSLPTRDIWVDLGDPDRRLALEADSFAFHGSPEALRRDCQRHDELISIGWLPLRFSHEQVTLESIWLTGILKDTCALRPRPRNRTRQK